MESYGIVSLFTLLHLSLGVVFAGITPVLNREMSRYTGQQRTLESTGNLLRTLEIISLFIGLIFVIAIYLLSDLLAQSWLIAEKLPTPIIAESLTLGSILVITRLIEGLYGGAIIGLQKQVALNVILVIGYTLKNAGVILALEYISPTLKCFCYWQILSAILVLIAEATYIYKTLPGMARKARFSFEELKNVWEFTYGSLANSLVSFFTAHSDKIILTKFLTLSEFGYYSLAVSVTNIIHMFSLPLSQAYYPQLVNLKSLNKDEEGAIKFHQCCQLINAFAGTAVFTLFFFGKELLEFWTQDPELAEKVFPIVKFLAIGLYCQALLHFPTFLSYTAGKPIVSAKINMLGLFLTFIAGLPLIMNYGITGAVWSNLLQNISVLALFPLLFNCYLKYEQSQWLIFDALIPGITIFSMFYLTKTFFINVNSELSNILIIVAIASGISLLSMLSCKHIMKWVLQRHN